MQRPPQQADMKLENLSREQLKKIEKSMKRPEFMGLLNEYMVEISDPKNKNQYDEYLRQMEKEGQLPKHMKLAKLKAEFCFRTHIISQKNKKHEMKLFINMCSSEYLEKPSCEPGPDQSGQKGFHWQVPHSMGKIRYDQDKHKQPCQVVDCAFHPDSFKFGQSYSSFQAMMISIALESAQRLLGERKETLSKDYVILKKLKCKGENGEPALLPIRYIKGKAYNKGEGPAQQERDLEGKQTKLQKQLNQQKEEYEKEKKEKQKDNKKDENQDNQMEQELDDRKRPMIEELEKGLQAPKYTSIYTYTTDYSEFLDDPNPNKKRKMRKLPSKMSVEFKVPRIQNMSEVNQLQINENKIVMGAGDKYFIDLSFDDLKCKYPLKTSEAKAKYDKKKKTLKIEIGIEQKDLQYEIQEQKVEEVQEETKEQKIIENETWKNKVLDVPDQAVGVKFLEEKDQTENKEPQKKLVEEIDQDDFVEEEQMKEPTAKVQQKFTVSKYYEENEKQKVEEEIKPKIMNHIFQQTNKQVIIVIQMMNYQKDDVKSIYHDGQMMVEWKKKNQIHIIHLCIAAERQNEIAKMEIIKRVGFYAFTITKSKNQFWEKSSILNQISEYEKENLYEKFKQNFRKLEKDEAEAIEAAKKEQEQIQKQKQEEVKKEQKKQVKGIETMKQESKKQSKMEQIDEEIKQQQNRFESVIPQHSIFEKLPPQFIVFDAPFIDALN